MIDLRRFWILAARQAAASMARRLTQRRGVDGRFLPDKRRPNGRPLGFGRSVLGIPGLLRRGRVRVTRAGFAISFERTPKVGWFHRGYRPQNRVPRPIAGIPVSEQQEIVREAADEAARQITRLVRRI